MIECKQLRKSFFDGYKEREIFNNINLTIQPKRFIGISGPSGSGKSTLLNIIAGLENFNSGEVLVDGIHLSQAGNKEKILYRRKKLGFIFQDFKLIPHLKVIENILIPSELNQIRHDLKKDLKRRSLLKNNVFGGYPASTHGEPTKAQKLFQFLGIHERLDEFPDRLSGGEQQRVAIARACLHSPRLILADEPTGNLDSKSAANVFALLKRIAHEFDSAVLMVTHDENAHGYVDQLYRLENKKLVISEF